MKTKDLVYIGIIGYLAYLLLRKKPTSNSLSTTDNEIPNGGLNLGTNMDLPNLTPIAPNGLSTEVALNSSNINPIIKNDNEPTQIFGNINLPTPYSSVSVVTPNPIDVVPVAETSTSSVSTTSTSSVPTASTSSAPTTSTSSEPTASTNPMPISSVGSIIDEPFKANQIIKGELVTDTPEKAEILPLGDFDIEDSLLDCPNSFSIPNADKENSYTNYWFDGTNYYIQTTSPLIKTIPTKISKLAYAEGCKKLQLFQTQNKSKA